MHSIVIRYNCEFVFYLLYIFDSVVDSRNHKFNSHTTFWCCVAKNVEMIPRKLSVCLIETLTYGRWIGKNSCGFLWQKNLSSREDLKWKPLDLINLPSKRQNIENEKSSTTTVLYTQKCQLVKLFRWSKLRSVHFHRGKICLRMIRLRILICVITLWSRYDSISLDICL